MNKVMEEKERERERERESVCAHVCVYVCVRERHQGKRRLAGHSPVVQWLVQRFRSERLRVRSRRSATFTPSAHVRRQSLPVWPPTLNLYLFFFKMFSFFFFFFFCPQAAKEAKVLPRCSAQPHTPTSFKSPRPTDLQNTQIYITMWPLRALNHRELHAVVRKKTNPTTSLMLPHFAS